MRFLNASEAARQLGVSTKALRLYEERGLVVPARTDAGWRTYGPDAMARAAKVVALRALGLSLAEVSRVLEGDRLEPTLAAHRATLEGQIRRLGQTIEELRRPRDPGISFALPWPWDGEPFELSGMRRLNYIVGPLGSGKTRFAMRLAEVLPGASFLGLDRSARATDEAALAALVADGATASDALIALLAGLEAGGPVVVDMVEHELDQATQAALIAHLRRRAEHPLFLMTRSSTILDLSAVGPDEAIILCPANHSPPTWVLPYPGAPGYESIATCLASPDVRARTRGIVGR